MKTYKYSEHTADVRLQVEANNLEDLFCISIQGMANLIKKDFCKSNAISNLKEELEIKSPDLSTLLIDLMSEVLTLTQINKAIYCKLEIQELENNKIKCFVYGSKVKNFDKDIKAVTYHEAEIKSENNIYKTTVVFDI